jgi:hypothetical protein
MKLKFTIQLLSLFTSVISLAQNSSYQLFFDSIHPIEDNNFFKSKKIFLENEKKMNYDPVLVLNYLGEALTNNEVKFYKKKVVLLMKEYGWSYSFSDTLAKNLILKVNNEILDKGLVNWTVRKSKKNYTFWAKRHPEALKMKQELLKLHASDQTARRFAPRIKDSLCYNYYRLIYDSILKEVDMGHVRKIQELSIQNNGELPNSFDHGIYVSNYIEFVLFHNFKQGNIEEATALIFPYLEKAYLNGKISSYFFGMYDHYCSIYYGYQYYGTLEDESIKVKDKENLFMRKQKYRL